MRGGWHLRLPACAHRAAMEWRHEFHAGPQWHAHALGGIAWALRQIERSAVEDRDRIEPERMNGWVDAPPPKKGMGCFARGCLTLVVFAIVLGIACFAGMYWGLHRHSAIFHGLYWLTKTHAIAQSPAPIPEFTASDAQIQSVHERCQDFEQKARAGQPAELELTPDDLNTLIATNRDASGQ